MLQGQAILLYEVVVGLVDAGQIVGLVAVGSAIFMVVFQVSRGKRANRATAERNDCQLRVGDATARERDCGLHGLEGGC